VVLQIRGGKMVAVKHIRLTNTDMSQSDTEVLSEFLAQYYLDVKSERALRDQAIEAGEDVFETPGAVFSADEVLIGIVPDDLELLERTLGIRVKTPTSDMEKQLYAVALTNCRHALSQAKKGEGGHGIQALEEIQDKIQLEKLPTRIECYDISNIQGEDAVASRVVFIDGAPDKNLYRRYKIRTVKGANDFAMMKEDDEAPIRVVLYVYFVFHLYGSTACLWWDCLL
jgi:excinuclease UvrABC nuclease subunit